MSVCVSPTGPRPAVAVNVGKHSDRRAEHFCPMFLPGMGGAAEPVGLSSLVRGVIAVTGYWADDVGGDRAEHLYSDGSAAGDLCR